MQPEYIFETSWEVCNKIGGIYAVLSTRAAVMQQEHKDKVFFIGPDITKGADNQYFKEVPSLLSEWKRHAIKQGLKVRIGRWKIPGRPIAILVDFNDFYQLKDQIYYHNWERFGVNSISAYGDYDESSIFGYAVGVVIESMYNYYRLDNHSVVAHCNEWMTSFTLFYVKEHLPKVGTLFTTHATGIGRSIAGNNKPLYDYFEGYNGDQMAEELNMVSKHSTEKMAAHHADCFTTVSNITNRECAQLLDKPADVVTPNGFESEFVPKTSLVVKRKGEIARGCLKQVAEQVLGYQLDSDALFIATSGRYEWKNKGIDVFIEALGKLNQQSLPKTIVAFIMIPAWITNSNHFYHDPLHLSTHQLCEPFNDPVVNTSRWLNLNNTPESKVKLIFAPSYLKGNDGVFNMSYYDLLMGFDLTVFPSYYEPWGYTPLESVAFHVPTITSSLAGFGQWAKENNHPTQTDTTPLLFSVDAVKSDIEHGVAVVERTDSNKEMVTTEIANIIAGYASLTQTQQTEAKEAAAQLAEKADWKHFFKFYHTAYEIALANK